MSEELRYSMTAAALEIGRKLGYVGAGTVEFILVSRNIWMLEGSMNP
jgi:acetyl/propionyl-CoA carboxylase alpha subunit